MRAGGFPLKKASRAPREAFKGHPGTFSQRGNTIAYSYESPNGPANVIVTFDERRRPVSTFFESAPLGSHEELMDAAQAIKNCVAYGPKARRRERQEWRHEHDRQVGEVAAFSLKERCGVCRTDSMHCQRVSFLTPYQRVHPIQDGTERCEKRFRPRGTGEPHVEVSERPHQVASGRSQETRGCARTAARANRPRLSSRYWLLRSAAAAHPNDATAYHNRAVAYGLAGDIDNAIADYTKVIEIAPSNASAYDNRGRAYASKGDYTHAVEDQTKAQELLAKAAAQPITATPRVSKTTAKSPLEAPGSHRRAPLTIGAMA